MIKDYNYYKTKYRTFTLKLDREKDADLIMFLEQWPEGPKHAITSALRVFKEFIRGGLGV